MFLITITGTETVNHFKLIDYMLRLIVLATVVVIQASATCDDLVSEYCMLPFPNDFFRSTSGSSSRLNFTIDTFPVDDHGLHLDPVKGGWNDLHGFQVMPAITAYFEHMVDEDISSCPRWWNMDTSVLNSSPTILIDTVTGERVAHWVELDHSSDKSNVERKHAFLMYPTTALQFDRRYVVAFTRIGRFGPEKSSPAFKALRDRSTTAPVDRQKHFDDNIFSVLAQAGVPRDVLLLAWDFTTNDKQDVTSRMIHARDDAAARLGVHGPMYKIESIELDYSKLVGKKIKGKFRMPLYLSTHEPVPSARLVLDESGLPTMNGYAWFDFEVIVPKAFMEQPESLGILHYGHGLFGTYLEADNVTYLHQDAASFGYVICASTWLGLSHFDIPAAGEIIGRDLTDFMYIPDRLTQGVINAHGLMAMMQGAFRRDPAMLTSAGESIVNPSKTAYFGNSCGGIMGTVYMATSQKVRRGLLGVPGGSFGLILPRSKDFKAEFDMLKVRYSDPVDRINLIQVIQMLWDRAEPAGYMRSISKELFPNTPSHQVLVHYGLADIQVSWLGAHAIGRSADAVMYASNSKNRNETYVGFQLLEDDDIVVGRSGVVGWDYKSAPVPVENIPPDDAGDTHESPRRDHRSQLQMGHFFLVGEIANTCQGPCVADTRPVV